MHDRIVRRISQQADQFGGRDQTKQHSASGLHRHPSSSKLLISSAAWRTGVWACTIGARELVVGSRGLGGFTGMLLGSTSATVAQHASCPVVVVLGDGHANGPVVVGLDGSPASEQALAYAFKAASRAGAVLLAVHGWGGLGAQDSRLADERAVEEIEAAAQRMLADQVAGWSEKYPRVAVVRKVIHQRPAAVLIELGHRARMIVVGSRGRGGFARLLLGSVSQAVVRHATCPVVVCHRKPEDFHP